MHCNKQAVLVFAISTVGWLPDLSELRLSLDTTVRCPLLARSFRANSGRACPLYPGTSDLYRFRDFKRVIHLNPEISYGAFNPGVAEKQLNCP